MIFNHAALTIRRERVGMVDLNTNPPELNLTFSASELWNSKMDNKLLTVEPLYYGHPWDHNKMS